MEYCIVEDGVIVNMIVAEADFAAEIGTLPGYDGAAIGGAYTPPAPEPEPPTTDERLEKLEAENKLLREQVSAQRIRRSFTRNASPRWRRSSMREFWAEAALTLYFLLSKGARDMMAMLFAQRVILGKTEFEKVPAKLKQQVADILINECGLPELVPAEFGGTAKAE